MTAVDLSITVLLGIAVVLGVACTARWPGAQSKRQRRAPIVIVQRSQKHG